ncbi:hypothetical protein B296_00019564 [Ensete ventricosum]|uniref:K-box domain-containing protein n=1 Tax=Ensete ventricosum TaxID=4639 RepID=A0A426YGU2_ENSVE|nr:hypothetical protein B296_00019564 [Ensete ventricosum]
MGRIPCDIPMTYYNYFRYLMGEQLDSLNLKELQQLENQLENSLKLIRSRKEKTLEEENKNLEKQVSIL